MPDCPEPLKAESSWLLLQGEEVDLGDLLVTLPGGDPALHQIAEELDRLLVPPVLGHRRRRR